MSNVIQLLNKKAQIACWIHKSWIWKGSVSFVTFSGVQNSQGTTQEGPTVTDVTAGESAVPMAGQMDGLERMSSVLPTMWLGAQSGW